MSVSCLDATLLVVFKGKSKGTPAYIYIYIYVYIYIYTYIYIWGGPIKNDMAKRVPFLVIGS